MLYHLGPVYLITNNHCKNIIIYAIIFAFRAQTFFFFEKGINL